MMATIKVKRQKVVLWILLPAAFLIRMYHINYPPAYSTRPLRSMIIARGYYYQSLPSIPQWQKDIAVLNSKSQPQGEPTIIEHLAYYSYRLAGRENIVIPQIFSCIFWIVGAWFLYKIGIMLMRTRAAIFAAAFYLFVPFGIFTSRKFQPDVLMVMMMLISIYAQLRFFENGTVEWFLMAAVLTGLAILIKPMSIFLVLGAFIALSVNRWGWVRIILQKKFLNFIIIAVLVGCSYYIYGLLISGWLRVQIDQRIYPHLLATFPFWKGWLMMIGKGVGWIAFGGAIYGYLLARGRMKVLLAGLGTGYVVYGLVFSYHIHTHVYYHLGLIPVVGLALGPVGERIIIRVCKFPAGRKWIMIIAAAVLLVGAGVVFSNMRYERLRQIDVNLRNKLEMVSNFIGFDPHDAINIISDFGHAIKTMKEIGDRVNHSDKTIMLSLAYSKSLEYYGNIAGINWPQRADMLLEQMRGGRLIGAQERFEKLCSKIKPEYFIITSREEFNKQEDLKVLLNGKYPLLIENDDYLIYDLRENKNPI